MSPAEQAGVFVSLFVTGLAGSLHCVAMCGPILLGFSRVIGTRTTGGLDVVAYHLGRLWTYAMLGLAAGWIGSSLRHGSAVVGLQRPLSIAVSLLVLASGLVALGLVPGWRLSLSAPSSCTRVAQPSWLRVWLREPARSARLVLGAIMGFLPCGLVYAALLVAATLPTPIQSAVGMVSFGAGTVPALAALVLGGRRLSSRFPNAGSKWAAAVLVLVGCWMLIRTLLMAAGSPHGS